MVLIKLARNRSASSFNRKLSKLNILEQVGVARSYTEVSGCYEFLLIVD